MRNVSDKSYVENQILREQHKLIVFENRVLRRIFGPKRDEVKCEWRRLHNKALYGNLGTDGRFGFVHFNCSRLLAILTQVLAVFLCPSTELN
jgi:hypothetical protein